MKMIRLMAGLLLLLYLTSSVAGQGNLNTDQIYQETVEPCRRTEYNLTLMVRQYRDAMAALTKENADLKKKLEAFEKPDSK